MTWPNPAQPPQPPHTYCMRSASGGFDQRQAFKQLQTAASAPEATLAGLAPAHMCTRFCQFQHQFGNLFRCVTSGTQHVCDQTCQQTVQVDPYTSVCRLSRKVFNTPAPAARQNSMKRMSEEALMEGQELLESSTKRQSCNGAVLPMQC